MNELLDERYIEITLRLLLGIEPRDAARGTRVTAPIVVAIEPPPPKPPHPPIPLADLERYYRHLLDVGLTLSETLPRFRRHITSRYALGFRADLVDHVDVRLFDTRHRFAPRRLRIPIDVLTNPADPTLLDSVPLADRTRQPALFPGRTYDVSESSTGLRGRVLRPDPNNPGAFIRARWPRVQATIGGAPVGFAHGDENGDFLLLLDNAATPALTLPAPLTADVTAFAPTTMPVPPTPLLPPVDAFWDVPLETLAAPGVTPDSVASGDYVPASYGASSLPITVTFAYGALREGMPAFTIV